METCFVFVFCLLFVSHWTALEATGGPIGLQPGWKWNSHFITRAFASLVQFRPPSDPVWCCTMTVNVCSQRDYFLKVGVKNAFGEDWWSGRWFWVLGALVEEIDSFHFKNRFWWSTPWPKCSQAPSNQIQGCKAVSVTVWDLIRMQSNQSISHKHTKH